MKSKSETKIARMPDIGSDDENLYDPKKDGSAVSDDGGTDETNHDDETLFLDRSDCFGDEDEHTEETIEFDEVYGSVIPGAIDVVDESYDPYIRYAYTRKIDGVAFVKMRRPSVIKRRQSLYLLLAMASTILLAVIGFGIYNLVVTVQENHEEEFGHLQVGTDHAILAKPYRDPAIRTGKRLLLRSSRN